MRSQFLENHFLGTLSGQRFEKSVWLIERKIVLIEPFWILLIMKYDRGAKDTERVPYPPLYRYLAY